MRALRSIAHAVVFGVVFVLLVAFVAFTGD